MTSHLLLLLVLVLVLLSHLFLFHLSLIHHVNKVLGCEAQELGPRDVLRRIGVGDGVGVRGRGLRVVGDLVLVVVFAWDLVLVAP